MQYDEKIAEKLLEDPRYVGAITPKMNRVWKNRGVIPNQYFNPKYVKLIKEGDLEKANQVVDPYYNPKFILKMDLTPDEKVLQEKLLKVLDTDKLVVAEICKQVGMPKSMISDAKKEREGKQVDLRSEHILALKKNITELRLKISKVVTPLVDKTTFSNKDVKDIDSLFEDKRLCVLPLIGRNEFYRGRIFARSSGRAETFDYTEVRTYVNCFGIFLVETAM